MNADLLAKETQHRGQGEPKGAELLGRTLKTSRENQGCVSEDINVCQVVTMIDTYHSGQMCPQA